MKIDIIKILISLLIVTSTIALGDNKPIVSSQDYLIKNKDLGIRINKWHIVDYYSHSGSHSWWCGPEDANKPEDDYIYYYDSYLESLPLNFDTSTDSITLSFWYDIDTSNDYNGGDTCYLYIESDQQAPIIIWGYDSPYDSNGWTKATIDLSEYRGHTNFRMRFYFGADMDSLVDDGWNIDDVVIKSTYVDVDLISPVEFNVWLPEGWTQMPSYSDNNDWHKYIYGNDSVARRYNVPPEQNSIDELISPIKSAADFTKLYLSYWTDFNAYNPSPYNTYGKVLGSTDGGDHWNYFINQYQDDFKGNETFEITSWAAGEENIRIKWLLEQDEPDDVLWWLLDSIHIYGDMTRYDFKDDVEHGEDGWYVYPESAVEMSSIGQIKALLK